MNKINVTAFVAFVFAVLAFLKVGIPETMTKEGVVAAVMATTSAALLVVRLIHGDADASGVKLWYQSKIVWTQIGTALIAVLALFGVDLGLRLEDFVALAMAVGTGLTMVFGTGGQAKIGRK